MPRLDGITIIAIVLVGSFAIDRIVTGLLFLLSFSDRWTHRFPNPDLLTDPAAQLKARNMQKLLYFGVAGALAIPLLAGYGKVRILAALGFPTDYLLDTVVTGLILMGGSDRVAELLKMPGAPGVERVEPKPITIQGSLVLEDKGRGTI
jgi:hypothetical protein